MQRTSKRNSTPTTRVIQTLFRYGDPMAISHELSSEIAAALFSAKERSPRELNDLKEVIFKIHSTLEQLTRDARMARVARAPQPTNVPTLKGKSAGKDS
jgi:hypothetical protein